MDRDSTGHPKVWRDPADFLDSDGFLEKTANTPHFDYVKANASGRYKNINGINDVSRQVLFIRPDYFVMLDNLAADSQHQYDWVCHFNDSVLIESNWVRGEAEGGQILGVGILAPQNFHIETGNDKLPFVHIRPQANTSATRFINILFPTDGASWSNRPDIQMLDDNGKAVAVQVQTNGLSSHTDEIILAYNQLDTATTVGPYSFDGHAAVVTFGGNRKLERLFFLRWFICKSQSEWQQPRNRPRSG